MGTHCCRPICQLLDEVEATLWCPFHHCRPQCVNCCGSICPSLDRWQRFPSWCNGKIYHLSSQGALFEVGQMRAAIQERRKDVRFDRRATRTQSGAHTPYLYSIQLYVLPNHNIFTCTTCSQWIFFWMHLPCLLPSRLASAPVHLNSLTISNCPYKAPQYPTMVPTL